VDSRIKTGEGSEEYQEATQEKVIDDRGKLEEKS